TPPSAHSAPATRQRWARQERRRQSAAFCASRALLVLSGFEGNPGTETRTRRRAVSDYFAHQPPVMRSNRQPVASRQPLRFLPDGPLAPMPARLISGDALEGCPIVTELAAGLADDAAECIRAEV